MEKPLISIVIPVYNRAHLIERCLDSIFAQTYRPLEVIVVDNNSSDQSLPVATKWMESHPDNLITYKTGRCAIQGASAARGVGQEMASSDYLAFFDSDDTMRPDLIKDAMEVFIHYPETDLVGWRVRFHFLDGATRVSHLWRPEQTLDYHLIHAVLRTQGYAIKRESLVKSGGWQPGFPVWDDWELGVRIMLTNPNVKVIDKVEADVWSQEESITGTDFKSKAGEWERIMDIVERISEDSGHPKSRHIARLVAYRRAILGALYKREGEQALAEELLSKAISSPHLSTLQRKAIRFSYTYTAANLRGAYSIVGPLL